MKNKELIKRMTKDFVQTYEAVRVDNGKKIKGSLLYDTDQACWRIVIKFFDVPRPKTENEFGVNAPRVDYSTITEVNSKSKQNEKQRTD